MALTRPPAADDVHQVLRQGRDRVLFSVVVDVFVHHNRYGVALFDVIVERPAVRVRADRC